MQSNLMCIALLSVLLNWPSHDQITVLLCLNIIEINHFKTRLSSTFSFQFGDEHWSYKVLKVPDYESVTVPPDPCEVNASENTKTTLSTLIAILATNIFLVRIYF